MVGTLYTHSSTTSAPSLAAAVEVEGYCTSMQSSSTTENKTPSTHTGRRRGRKDDPSGAAHRHIEGERDGHCQSWNGYLNILQATNVRCQALQSCYI
ncbi:hypothetical protein E2C01_042173 [Portunus trituberculatus]|uniref:Uncharacterized protein n=1 Tax=Portunus trituberculatus TaxID=210409 RepID=A0A5B7FLS8_PORTR|nr:hypothetical protein [Portunus trituberculatus]